MQCKWLDRLAKLTRPRSRDRHRFRQPRLAPDGGAKQLDVRLGGKLHAVLDTFADALWPSAA